MASVFDRVADIIAENSEVPREKITPDAHVINDLGIDSLDFLDIVFAIDKAFGIKVPVEAWTQEVNAGTAPAEQYFVMKHLAERIEELVAAKQAKA
jgi:acyl carrier protein